MGQNGYTCPSGKVGVEWLFSAITSAPTSTQAQLDWGCQAGALPQWVMGSLHGTEVSTSNQQVVSTHTGEANIQAICDGKTAWYMPDYWSTTFQTDWDGYLSAVNALFKNTFPTTAVYYVRGGFGLADEGNPYDDGSGSIAQIQAWAQPWNCQSGLRTQPESLAPRRRFLPRGGTLGKGALSVVSAQARCPVSTSCTQSPNFKQSTLKLQNGEYATQDVAEWYATWAEWAASLGSNGMNTGWDLGS